MVQIAPFTSVLKYWVPGSELVRGYEVSSFFRAEDEGRWSEFIDLPARQRQHFISGECREFAGNLLGFRRFQKTVVLNSGEVARWTVSHDKVLSWSFSFRGTKLNGNLPLPPKSDLFYSIHSLAFDTFVGRIFLASGKSVYFLPTVSIPVLPESVGSEKPPIHFSYYRLEQKEPPQEVQALARNFLDEFSKDELMWLQVHSADSNIEKQDPKLEDAVWQLYALDSHGAQLVFCYVPQYPSCYSRISMMLP